MATLKDVFFKGLREANKEDVSVGSFEERQKTVGSSDVGGCIRKAVLSKLNKVEYDEKTLLTFALGHSVEEVLRKSFEANKFKYHYQYRVKNGFMVANIDFCWESKQECVIVELKTTSNLPSSPYEEHILQVQYQMALLREEKKKNVRAKIFYIDLATKETAEFDISFDDSLAKIALERAKRIHEYVLKKEIPNGEEKLYCYKCPFKHNCPTYMKGAINQYIIINEIEEIVRLEEEVKKIQKILKEKKENIKNFLEKKDIKKAKVGNYLVSITSSSSYTSIDTAKLKREEPKLYEELISKFGKQIVRNSSIKIK